MGLPLHHLEGKRAQMEFARAGDSGSGDVLTISSGREKARDDKVALKREGVDPYVKGPPLTAARRSGSLPRSSTLIGVKGPEEELEQWQRSIADAPADRAADGRCQSVETAHGREPGRMALQPQTSAAVAPEVESEKGASVRAIYEDAANNDSAAPRVLHSLCAIGLSQL